MKFTNLPEYLNYRDFQINSQVNQHTVCKVTFTIDSEKEEDFLSLAEKRTKTEICSDSGTRIMNGIVSAVTVINASFTSVTAEVTVTSESLLLEEKGENRIFQNPEKTFADILKSYSEVETGKCENLNEKVEEIIYQYKINDFEFLKYLAQKCGTALWITEEGKVTFGNLNYSKSFSDSEQTYQKSILEKKVTVNKNNRELSVLTMEQIPNGSVLKYNQTDYIICSVELHEELDEVYFRYTGYDKLEFEKDNAVLSDLTTEAVVKDNNDPDTLGRLQVEFSDFKNEGSERTWIPYLTTYIGQNKGGVVMLPDSDDTVVVHISQSKPYVIGSLRKDVIPDNCKDPDKKFFAMKDTLITLDSEQIIVTQGEKSKVTVVEDSITAEHDKSKVYINQDTVTAEHDKSKLYLNDDTVTAELGKSKINVAKDSITCESGKSGLKLDNSSIVAENGKSNLEISGNKSVLTGNSSQLSLNNGTTVLKGRSIDLKTQAIGS